MSKAFTLIEILVGISLFFIILLGVYGAFQLGVKIVNESAMKVTATAIANEKLEQIRNLAYEDIGVLGNYPDGVLLPIENVSRSGFNFEISFRIDYIDNEGDGTSPLDACPNDYKLVQVKVAWQGRFGGEVYGNTVVSPKNQIQECNEIGGFLEVSVFDSAGVMVASPSIEVESIDTGLIKIATPDTGTHSFILPEGIDDYKIMVSKDSYSQERTFAMGEEYNSQIIASPNKPQVTLLENNLTETSFSIDRLSDVNIKTLEAKIDGDIYYVRKVGSDGYDGFSPDSAFLTVQKAADVMVSGDIVFVGQGTYEEVVSPLNSGTSLKKIVYVADKEGAFTGDEGEVIVRGYYIDNKQNIEIYGFTFDTAVTSSAYIKGSDIKLADNIFSNAGDSGIFIDNASDVEVSFNEIYLNKNGINIQQSNGVVILGNKVFQNQHQGLNIEDSSSIDSSFNEVFSNGDSGFVFSNANDCEVKDNLIHSNTDKGVALLNNSSLIEVSKNKVYSNQEGVYSSSSISNYFISNLIYDNNIGLNIEAGSNLYLSSNTCFQNVGQGVYLKNTSNTDIINNIFVGNSVGFEISSSDTYHTHNNVWNNTSNYQGLLAGTSSISADPLFVDVDGTDDILGTRDDAFSLSQVVSGQGQDSPCLDIGSNTAASLSMADKTTRSDLAVDAGIVDLGFHYSLTEIPLYPGYPDPFGDAISNVTFDLRGNKTVGKDESEEWIYKYREAKQSDSSGNLLLADMEWDVYNFSNFNSSGIGLNLALSWPSPMDIILYPGVEQEIRLGLRVDNSLEVFITDNDLDPVFSAEVKLYNLFLGYERSLLTDEQGRAYFIPLESSDNYSLEIRADGYSVLEKFNILITGQIQEDIILIP